MPRIMYDVHLNRSTIFGRLVGLQPVKGVREMKRFALMATLLATSGCSYAGVAFLPPDKVVIVRNGFFGARDVFVCTVSEHGAERCQSKEAP
jgi:hypothetical protein